MKYPSHWDNLTHYLLLSYWEIAALRGSWWSLSFGHCCDGQPPALTRGHQQWSTASSQQLNLIAAEPCYLNPHLHKCSDYKISECFKYWGKPNKFQKAMMGKQSSFGWLPIWLKCTNSSHLTAWDLRQLEGERGSRAGEKWTGCRLWCVMSGGNIGDRATKIRRTKYLIGF